MRSITLYNTTSTGKTKVLEVSVDGDTLTTRWWQEDKDKKSKVQETSEKGKAKNVGKANEISAPQNAEDLFDRKVTKKKEEGYTENEADLKVEHDPFSLPRQFAPAKPRAELITDAELEALIDTGNCWTTEKRDGQRAFIFKMPDGSVRVMSRRMKDYTENVPQIVASVKHVPNGSILDVELIASQYDDDYDYVGSILRSKPEKALDKQEKAKRPLYAYVFDALYWDGDDITHLSFLERHEFVEQVVLSAFTPNDYLMRCHPLQAQSVKQVKAAYKMALKDGLEGFVIWDGTAPTVLRYDGKPSRKGGAFKLKPVLEDDFVVYGFEHGKGKYERVVGKLHIGQYNTKGEFVPWGKCGGFAGDSSIRETLLKEDLTSGTLVVQVEFSKRNKTGLRFPVMQRIRRDKAARECIYNG